MDIDQDIAFWVLDFLLRQPLEEWIFDSLIRTLPIRNHDPTLIKLLLLKKLDLQLSTHSISEDTLDVLEKLEELEFQEGGATVTESMRLAYCAVAVDCTVKPLSNVNGEDKFDRFMSYCEAVRRVWRKRFGRMEKVLGKGGLVSREICLWKEEIVAAVGNDKVHDAVVKKCEQVNAVEAVGKYVREEREKMGSSFLEMVAVRVKNDEVLQGLLGVRTGDEGEELQDIEIQGGEIGSTKPCNSIRAKIVHLAEMTAGLRGKKHVVEGASEKDNHANGCGGRKEKAHHNHVEEKSDKANFVDDVDVDRAVNDAGVDHATGCDVSTVPGRSLVKRNTSTHTHECDKPVNESKEEVGDGCSGADSPLKKRHKSKERRIPRKWSLLEEDTLRTGVQKHGRGNWKLILRENEGVFENRTEVDLKDKWRNMTRYGQPLK